jgi:hypothetical protein
MTTNTRLFAVAAVLVTLAAPTVASAQNFVMMSQSHDFQANPENTSRPQLRLPADAYNSVATPRHITRGDSGYGAQDFQLGGER